LIVQKTKDKGNKERQRQKEIRKCYNCNNMGNLAKDCTKVNMNTDFAGCILIKKSSTINDKDNIDCNKFYLRK
jgi:succinate dehydrogenase/fumarate reductase-like Fe-S protein